MKIRRTRIWVEEYTRRDGTSVPGHWRSVGKTAKGGTVDLDFSRAIKIRRDR